MVNDMTRLSEHENNTNNYIVLVPSPRSNISDVRNLPLYIRRNAIAKTLAGDGYTVAAQAINTIPCPRVIIRGADV